MLSLAAGEAFLDAASARLAEMLQTMNAWQGELGTAVPSCVRAWPAAGARRPAQLCMPSVVPRQPLHSTRRKVPLLPRLRAVTNAIWSFARLDYSPELNRDIWAVGSSRDAVHLAQRRARWAAAATGAAAARALSSATALAQRAAAERRRLLEGPTLAQQQAASAEHEGRTLARRILEVRQQRQKFEELVVHTRRTVAAALARAPSASVPVSAPSASGGGGASWRRGLPGFAPAGEAGLRSRGQLMISHYGMAAPRQLACLAGRHAVQATNTAPFPPTPHHTTHPVVARTHLMPRASCHPPAHPPAVEVEPVGEAADESSMGDLISYILTGAVGGGAAAVATPAGMCSDSWRGAAASTAAVFRRTPPRRNSQVLPCTVRYIVQSC